jgi:hypothetical protein
MTAWLLGLLMAASQQGGLFLHNCLEAGPRGDFLMASLHHLASLGHLHSQEQGVGPGSHSASSKVALARHSPAQSLSLATCRKELLCVFELL